jgi:hypothetical protein
MRAFEPVSYGPIFAELLHEVRLMELGPGSPNRQALPLLDKLGVERAFAPRAVRDADMAGCCLAGIWLYHDFLDPSHTLSQSIETTSATGMDYCTAGNRIIRTPSTGSDAWERIRPLPRCPRWLDS